MNKEVIAKLERILELTSTHGIGIHSEGMPATSDDQLMYVESKVRLNAIQALDIFDKNNIEKQKPRTNTEYERVDLVEPWEYFKLMSDEGDLYVNCTDLSYEGMLGDNINLANALHDGSCLYRKVETEIDERQEFIDTYNELRREFKLQHKAENFHNFLFDSGKFKLVE